jgi:hypothetical protein
VCALSLRDRLRCLGQDACGTRGQETSGACRARHHQKEDLALTWRDRLRFGPRPEELLLECEECLEVKSDPARVGSLADVRDDDCEVQRKGISDHANDPPSGDDDALVVAAMGKAARIGTRCPRFD